mgnify:CR=1 FL=1
MTVARSTPVRRSRTPIMRILGEWAFALFLFAGYYKADPRLGFIQTHIDITLLFLILSVQAFFLHGVRKSFKIKMPLGFTKVAALFLLLTACLLGGLLYTQSRQYGFDKALRFIFLTGWAFFGSALLILDFLSLRRFSWALVTISTVMAIDALLKYSGLGQVSFVTAFESNYIALARASGLGLLATVVFLLPTERRPLVRLLLWIAAALQLWAALSAGARGPVLALILSFLLFFALSVRGFLRLRIEHFALRLGVLALLATIILAVIGQEFFATLVFRTQILLTEVDTSAATRLDLYQAALHQWARSPIWGGGAGQFGVAVTGQDIRLYPHNIVLELGAEIGLIGVLVFVIMIGIAFREGLTRLHNGGRFAKTVGRYLLVASCFALLNAMVSGDINDNRILFTFIGLLGVADRFLESSKWCYGPSFGN